MLKGNLLLKTKINYMKNYINNIGRKSALVLLLICNIQYVNAQQVFEGALLKIINGRKVINFTVKKEVNVFQYRIEATNDTSSFSPIGTLQPIGNTMLARNYQFEIYTPLYKYYRVCMIGMNSRMDYAEIITTDIPIPKMEPGTRSFKKNNTIVINKN